jgi:hypothetical protein
LQTILENNAGFVRGKTHASDLYRKPRPRIGSAGNRTVD